jgi:hypothetical protein
MLQRDYGLRSFVFEYLEVACVQIVDELSFVVEHGAVQDDFFGVDAQGIYAGRAWPGLLGLLGRRRLCAAEESAAESRLAKITSNVVSRFIVDRAKRLRRQEV